MEHNKTTHSHNKTLGQLLAVLGMVVLASGISFAAGVHYQKGKVVGRQSLSSRMGGDGFGSPGGMRRGGFGSVTAVSATSITVQDQRTATTKTYTISSATTITNNGATATIADIKVGDQVIVQADSASTTTAAQIIANPTMGPPSGATQLDAQTN